MPKIVNFKLEISDKGILKALSGDKNIETMDVDKVISLKEEVNQYIKKGIGLLRPATIYTTLERPDFEKIPREGKIGEIRNDLIEGNIALTVFLVTIGDIIDKEIIEERKANHLRGAQILELVAGAALNQATRFVKKLISEEAQNENCEVELWLSHMDEEIQQAIAKFLDLKKIGVSIKSPGKILPPRSILGFFKWITPKKVASSE